MPPCNCGSNKKRVKYRVKMANGQTVDFDTITEAQAACKGCPIQAVNAA